MEWSRVKKEVGNLILQVASTQVMTFQETSLSLQLQNGRPLNVLLVQLMVINSHFFILTDIIYS